MPLRWRVADDNTDGDVVPLRRRVADDNTDGDVGDGREILIYVTDKVKRYLSLR